MKIDMMMSGKNQFNKYIYKTEYSIKLTQNISFVNKIVNIFNKIELIENYQINYFDNNIINYSILSNSTPDKLINEFEKFNIKVSENNNMDFEWIN